MEKGKEVEVSNKEGFEGAWLVATVIRPSSVNKNIILVEYQTLFDEEENIPLQGYVDLLHLRPLPPTQKNWIFQLNEGVEAYFIHGWWKGVISKVLEDSKYTVYFKTFEEEIDFQYWELRTHREWVGGRWTSSQDQDTTFMEQIEGSGRSLNPTGRPALNIDKVTQPSLSEAMDNYWENIVFTTDEEPSANEAHSSSDPALTTQEMSSTSKATDEFVTPCEKIRGGEETDTTLSLKRCHALGTSKGSGVEAQNALSFSTVKVQSNVMEAEHSEDISVPKPYVQCQKELHAVLRTQQMNDPLFDTGIAEAEKPKESVAERKRGRPSGSDRRKAIWKGKTQESRTSNSQTSGMSFQAKGTVDEITNNDLNRSKLLSPTMEEHQTPLFLEQSNLPTDEDNSDAQLLANEAITSKENSSRSFKHSEFSFEARGDEKVLQPSVNDTRNAHSSPMQLDDGSLLLEKESLPFIKSSNLWGTFESLDVFRLVPQCPHFQPLEKENEVLREGTALGKMINFANLMESTCKAHLNEPRRAFENKLKALPDMEEHGFTVRPIQSRLEKMLSMKDSHSQLEDRSKNAKRKLSDATHKLDEIDESISQLNMELQELLTKKETRDLEVAKLQKTRDSIKESMQKAKIDFERVIAAPWKSKSTM
ncbi:hypothetical protein FRX31_019991 [Thalictrum thalictroides]|uniref:Agenet domain-containing protein n=1 Tax=Thalictrum thalictroides TaxID=46969 RepID=A0A7J6W0Z7_THATH|nr:hypothetical protein FRX31_019991 [Thalictrum thalictroides]